jgi:hypothetical protein
VYFVVLYVFEFDILVWLGLKEQKIQTTHKPRRTDQVFNIGPDIFTYDDAKLVCRAYDSELATPQQMVEAWEDGAHWENVGWIDEQMAVYPTQKTQNTIREIHGGYYKDKTLNFGVNCYGQKPGPTKGERIKPNVLTQSQKEKNRYKKIKEELKNAKLSAFNKQKWSEFQ